ncbi:hypothetical protein LVY72_13530 [Arthrobacter sp. I2-34]|uniref:Uncharacterized protein n=1 Tax=Arthrobacter hankyongi TaxID=2904801 RepID=A0ABS9L8J3_9MICC|nr:hypothetical protein [Arthrobacter hankyongi]MCG2622918.1 hypothetical protein [Arthrobacter hankyongi]
MAFFGAARQARRDDKELGKGLWRRLHDRYRRGLDRYHQILEGVADEALYAELVAVADQLSGQLPEVRRCCTAAQREAPSEGMDVPGGRLGRMHRYLSKAGNSVAAAAEAAAMARLAGEQRGPLGDAGVPAAVASVRRQAAVVLEDIAEAVRCLEARD